MAWIVKTEYGTGRFGFQTTVYHGGIYIVVILFYIHNLFYSKYKTGGIILRFSYNLRIFASNRTTKADFFSWSFLFLPGDCTMKKILKSRCTMKKILKSRCPR